MLWALILARLCFGPSLDISSAWASAYVFESSACASAYVFEGESMQAQVV